MIRLRHSQRSLPATHDELRRAAQSVARSQGWEIVRALDGTPDRPEARLVVSGSGTPGRCILRIRERMGDAPAPDIAPRRAAASEHVVGVVRELPSSRVRGREVDAVLLTPAEEGALERILHDQRGLRGGEAATVLLGVAAGVAALHRAGWSRPELSARGVVFAADACPALDALDAAIPYSQAAAAADADAFYGFARSVCLRVADGSGMRLLAAVEAGLRGGSWGTLEAAVLAAVAPEPVALAREPDAAGEPPQRSEQSPAAGEPGPRAAVTPASRPGTRPGERRRGGERIGGAVTAAMDALDGEPVRTAGRALAAWLKRRPAVVVAGLVPLAAALAVVALLPASPAESASAAGSRSSGASSTDVPAPPGVTSTGPTSTSAAPQPTTVATPGPRPASPAATTLRAEDPVTAAGALLDARHACFTVGTGGAECLALLLDREPAFAAQETDALSAPAAADARDYTGAGLSLVETWGDAALVAVAPDAKRTPHSEPASLLLVRGEAGWRLRAVFP